MGDPDIVSVWAELSNVTLIPAGATEKEPLASKEGFEVIFNGLDWEYIKILSEEERKKRL